MSLYVYVFAFVVGIYTCKTENFGKETSCLYLCYYREYVNRYKGYVHMQVWKIWQQAFVFMFVLL